jgi:hypothetical protein
VTYNTAAFPSLLRTLISLLRPPNSAHRPRLLLAYKKRDSDEGELWDMLRREGTEMILVEKIEGVMGSQSPVEIWVGAASAVESALTG